MERRVGNKEFPRVFPYYGMQIQCDECGDVSVSMSSGRCTACGSMLVNARTVVVPYGAAIIDEECDFEKLTGT